MTRHETHQPKVPILIVYFSLPGICQSIAPTAPNACVTRSRLISHGYTAYLAEMIQKFIGGTSYRLLPKDAYPIAYDELVAKILNENKTQYLPPIANKPLDLANFETIFIGFPIWCGTIPAIINTFLQQYDFSKQRVLMFSIQGARAPIDTTTQIKMQLKTPSRIDAVFSLTAADMPTANHALYQWLKAQGFTMNN